MPRFYFISAHNFDRVPDEDGMEFPNLQAATDEARRALLDMASDLLPNKQAPQQLSITILSEQGVELVVVTIDFTFWSGTI